MYGFIGRLLTNTGHLYLFMMARMFGRELVAALGVEIGLCLVGVVALRVCRVLGDTVVAFTGDFGTNRWILDYCKFLDCGSLIGDRVNRGLAVPFAFFPGCDDWAYACCNLTIVEPLCSQPLLPRRVVFIWLKSSWILLFELI